MEASFDRQFEAHRTFGDTSAEYMAAVGGSWRFVFGFAGFIVLWMLINSAFGDRAAWDPYPYILLNLVLSCLSAFQAPLILMSQNKQVQRDRCQSDYTARMNLRAELVTRHINAKLDAFISTAWRRLYESQAIQTSTVQSLLDLERQQVALVRALGRAQARARAGSKEDLGAAGGLDSNPSGGDGVGAAVGVTSSLSFRSFGRRMSEEAMDPSAAMAQELVPGMVLQVYDDDDEEAAEGTVADGKEAEQQGDEETGEAAAVVGAAAAAVDEAGSCPSTPPPRAGQSSSLVVQTSPAARKPTAFGIYSTPLAALCVAPPAARGLRALELPWLLETEEDPHTIFLMRTMLRAVAASRGGAGDGGGLWEDAERMIFEHRSSSADNFFGIASSVHLQSRDPSLASKGVVCTGAPAMLGRSGSGSGGGGGGKKRRQLLRQGSGAEGGAMVVVGSSSSSSSTQGRRVAPAFVSCVVDAASLVDTGGGAEPWFPFDVGYDLAFPGDGAALDSLLAGDAILTLRNALDLPFQTSMGEIRQMTLHPRGCPCSRLCDEAPGAGAGAGGGLVGPTAEEAGSGSAAGPRVAASAASSGLSAPALSRAMSGCTGAIYVRQGEIPPRFKPSLSQDRDDRISDFWKMPLSRVQVRTHGRGERKPGLCILAPAGRSC